MRKRISVNKEEERAHLSGKSRLLQLRASTGKAISPTESEGMDKLGKGEEPRGEGEREHHLRLAKGTLGVLLHGKKEGFLRGGKDKSII